MATSLDVAPPRRPKKSDLSATESAVVAAPQDLDRLKQTAGVNDRVDQFWAAVGGTRVDGLPFFCDVAAGSGEPKVIALQNAAKLRSLCDDASSADPSHAGRLRTLLRCATRRDGKPTTESKGIPKPEAAYHSEAQQFSVLRTDWSPAAAELAIDWSQPEMPIEFCVGGTTIFQGPCEFDVAVDGAALAPAGTWEEVCWESNVDVDYLELEIALEGGARLQRQFVLTRRDGLLYVADTLLSLNAGKIETALRLPTAAGLEGRPAAETREITLACGKRKLLLVPPALPEWRSERRVGELSLENATIALSQQSEQSRGIYSPLLVVYDATRAKRECTWRRLTVGEDMQLVAADRACAYRLQLGKEHWLAYRSLTERANRTFMGINLQTNFLLTRFTTDGENAPLVEIDD